ncbi:Dihydroorotase [hydrothermal vent metagenome]|uniref:dihydroorotase n=1 Tax=hydrothermal vent metagenome TaxID=652676 RepID=A0A1W1B9A8_9ZZZZ
MPINLDSPLDMHLHLRDGEMLQNIALHSASTFSGAIIMPNLVPPISTKDDVIAYKRRIMDAIGDERFTPYMTLFFKPTYSREFLESVADEIAAIKLYPAGITTNSDGGVSGFEIEELRDTLEAMSDLGIPLCIHGETNGFVMDREAEFVPIYEKLASNFPNLTIIMEHITTADSVEALDRFDNLYATITLHHLLITLDDVAGGMLQPHLFCKPIAKRPEDREALLRVALEAHPKVMFGSDSAPHPREAKESCGCAAGVFTAPIALQRLLQLFDENGASMDNLQKFISTNAINIYGIDPIKKRVVLEREEFIVPDSYGGVVPMYAGEKLPYSIVDID